MSYHNDTIKHGGATFRVTLEHDHDHGAPWEEEDGHGPVSEWKRWCEGQGVKPPKRAGERILVWDRGSYRTYDMQAAIALAKAEGWDAKPYGGTAGERAARAVEADFQRMRAWCNDEWSYVGVIVELLDDNGDALCETASLWGIESDCAEYINEVAHELASEVLANLESRAA